MDEFLSTYLEKLPKLSIVDAKIVLGDLFDKAFGVFDHTEAGNKRPLSSVAIHAAEQYNSDSVLEESMRVYIDRNVHGNFHISFLEFVELPRDVAQLILKVCDDVNRKNGRAMSELESQLSQMKPS